MSVKLVNCVPVYTGTLAEKFAINFGEILEEEGYKAVSYRSGTTAKRWTYDLYVIPKDAVRTSRQCNLDNSAHLIMSLRSGYIVSGLNNRFVDEIDYFLVNHFGRSAKENLLIQENTTEKERDSLGI